MNFLNDTITFIDQYCIDGIFISVLLILLIRLLFKYKTDTHYAALLLKWLILSFSFLILINIIEQLLFPRQAESQVSFINRAFGPYFWAYWIMFFFSALFPLLLLFKKLGDRLYFLLLVAILMNIGWLFESFVIHMSSLHRDFATELNPYVPYYRERMILFRGLCLGIGALLFGNILHVLLNKKRTSNL